MFCRIYFYLKYSERAKIFTIQTVSIISKLILGTKSILRGVSGSFKSGQLVVSIWVWKIMKTNFSSVFFLFLREFSVHQVRINCLKSLSVEYFCGINSDTNSILSSSIFAPFGIIKKFINRTKSQAATDNYFTTVNFNIINFTLFLGAGKTTLLNVLAGFK